MQQPPEGEPWVVRYREIWSRNFSLFLVTLILFIASVFLGWQIIEKIPNATGLLVPQAMLEKVIDGQRWFDELNHAPLVYSYMIAKNNITVGLNAFLLSILLGIGGCTILIFNGLFFGALFAYCYLHHFDDQLALFVIGHGPLELSIIVVSAFSGLLMGRVFYTSAPRLIGRKLMSEGKDAFTILIGALPWLILAGIIEAFISPFPDVSLLTKIGIGLVAGTGFWLWTFPPKLRLIREP